MPWISNAHRLGRALRPEGTRSEHGPLLRVSSSLEDFTVSGAQDSIRTTLTTDD